MHANDTLTYVSQCYCIFNNASREVMQAFLRFLYGVGK